MTDREREIMAAVARQLEELAMLQGTAEGRKTVFDLCQAFVSARLRLDLMHGRDAMRAFGDEKAARVAEHCLARSA